MMQCRYCWVHVKARSTEGKTWGKGEDSDERRWVHDGTINASGNPACHRTFLSDDDIEETDSDTDEET